ncbi:MAG: hypothetical protein DIU80_003140 [Chloroflexota bacterium]|nr:MAG: hypothetical protein DIU80_10450 [Chloroflexota bacterium]
MAMLLKDCGLEGFRGSVQRCASCGRHTAHFRRPGGWPVCGVCGTVTLPPPGTPVSAVPPQRADVIPLHSDAPRRAA